MEASNNCRVAGPAAPAPDSFRCPLCLESDCAPSLSKGGYSYHGCRSCRHVFVFPLPSEEDTLRHYADNFSDDYLQQSDAWFKVLGEKRTALLPNVSGGRLLDVGCGYGHFLAAARDRGWIATGIDYSGNPVKHARGLALEILEGELLERLCDLPSARWDAITFWHVLEHLESPRKILQESLRLLAPGGRIYLNSPNIDSAAFHLLGKHWTWIYTPGHLQYFHRQGLAAILESFGMRIERSETWTDAPNLYFLAEEAVLVGISSLLIRGPSNRARRYGQRLLAFAGGETNHKKVQARLLWLYRWTPLLDRVLRRRHLGHEFLIVAVK